MDARIERLKKAAWTYVTPEILTAADAWVRRTEQARFYVVTWQDDQPIAFSRIEFQAQIGCLFKVLSRGNSFVTVEYLQDTEIVLLFKDTLSGVR